jgi:biopolymer transport protein ExbB
MNGFDHFWNQGDAVTHSVAVMLLLMSLASWVLIVWKTWLLRRVRQDVTSSVNAFWGSPSLDDAAVRLATIDREQAVSPLLRAARENAARDTLAALSEAPDRITRSLRNALNETLRRLQFGQTLLASIGSTSPFVGLFGTVWGIYHALVGISSAGQISIDKISGPVGEALIMTAAGLVVAIPAVLAFNILGRMASQCEAELEGFAHDLREFMLDHPEGSASAVAAGMSDIR